MTTPLLSTQPSEQNTLERSYSIFLILSSMAKLHIKNRYWVTPDTVLTHRWLSWKAKWIYWYIQSKPENWDFAISRFEWKDGKDSTQSWVWELEKFWYLNREKKRQPDGTWDIEYTLYESPEDNPSQGGKSVTDKATTTAENPPLENPPLENPPTNTYRDTKTEIIKQIHINSFYEKKEFEKPEEVTATVELVEKHDPKQEKAKFLYWIRTKVGVEKFKDPNEWTETWRTLHLAKKLGKETFLTRLEATLDDPFKLKNCNRLSFLRKEIESYIVREPVPTSSAFF